MSRAECFTALLREVGWPCGVTPQMVRLLTRGISGYDQHAALFRVYRPLLTPLPFADGVIFESLIERLRDVQG